MYQKYRAEWAKAQREDYLPKHPLHVDIELSDICNLRCRMCIHGSNKVNKGSGFMDEKLAMKLIDECANMGVYSIKFNWRGEVTLNDFLPKAIDYAKKKGILEVQINTNGLPWQDDILVKCAESGIDRIIFSIDGFSKETYESLRLGGDYGQLIGNVHTLLKWKKENRVSKPLIRVQMVRTKNNIHEELDYIKYWQGRVDDIRISDVMDRGQGDGMRIEDQEKTGRKRCPQPFQRLVVGRDGRVSPCCVDWYQEYIVGCAKADSLANIWNSDRMNHIRHIQNKCLHGEVSICRRCFVKESYVWKKCA